MRASLNKVALMAELPTVDIDSIRVAEAQRLLDLADALCLGGSLENWFGGTQMFRKTRLVRVTLPCVIQR